MAHPASVSVATCWDLRASASVSAAITAEISRSFSFSLIPDIDECYEGIDGCDINADCYDLPGSYTCFCRVGYTGNGTTCTGKPLTSLSLLSYSHHSDIDECSLNISSCDLATMNCLNTAGSFSCMGQTLSLNTPP